MPDPGVLDGVVVDADDRAVAGAVVALVRRSDAKPQMPLVAGTTTTDASGRFRLERLAAGTFTATATAAALTPAVERHIEILNGQVRTVRLKLGRGGFTLQGQVKETDGGILPGARVTVRPTPSAVTGCVPAPGLRAAPDDESRLNRIPCARLKITSVHRPAVLIRQTLRDLVHEYLGESAP
jgi:Carboxypeptidase regulatory-like domain